MKHPDYMLFRSQSETGYLSSEQRKSQWIEIMFKGERIIISPKDGELSIKKFPF